MKKAISLLLSVLLVLCMAVPAFAAETNKGSGAYGFEVDAKEEAAKKAVEDAYAELEKAKAEQADAEEDVEAKQQAADDAAKALEEAKKPVEEAEEAQKEAESELDAAKEETAKADEAVEEAQKEKDAADQDVKDAEDEKAAAEKAVSTAQSDVAEAEKAYDNAEDNLANSKADMDAAKAELEAAEAVKTKGSLGFFEAMGATDAAKVITDRVEVQDGDDWGKTEVGADGDATSLDNMKATFDWIRECNELRESDDHNAEPNKDPLMVTDYLMAVSQVQTNASSVKRGHSQFYSVGENIAWGYSDPYDGWYTKEKKVYEYRLENPDASDDEVADACGSSVDGHYKNIVNPDDEIYSRYVVTGFAYVTKDGTMYGVAHGQTFHWTESDDSYTVDEYEKRFNDYLDKVEADIAAAQEKYDAAKAIYDEYERNDGITDEEKQKIDDAKTALDEAETDLASAEEALGEAEAVAGEKAEALEAAEKTQKEKAAAEKKAKTKADNAKAKYDEAKAEYDEKLPELEADKEAADKALAEAKEKAAAAKEKRELAADKLIEALAVYDAIVVTDMKLEVGENEYCVGDKFDVSKLKVTITHYDKNTEELKEGEYELIDAEIPKTLTPEEILAASDGTVNVTFKVKYKGKEIEATIKVKLGEYKVIENADGTYTKGSGEDYSITSNANFDKHSTVHVGGVEVAKENYTAVSGSTKITFKNSYMEGLDEGAHKVQIFAVDGVAETEMTVKPEVKETEPEEPANTDTTPGETDQETTTPGETDQETTTPGETDQETTTPGDTNQETTPTNTNQQTTTQTETKKSNTVPTGDENSVVIWMVVFAMAGVLAIGVAKKNLR